VYSTLASVLLTNEAIKVKDNKIDLERIIILLIQESKYKIILKVVDKNVY